MLDKPKKVAQGAHRRIALLIILVICGSLLAWPSASPLLHAARPCTLDQTALSLEPAFRADAGCIVLDKSADQENKVLTIISPRNLASIPGGQSKRAETAACTAIRETYEETGFKVTPVKLATVWENGFHIFECQLTKTNSEMPEVSRAVLPLVNLIEVAEIRWISQNEFDLYQWRFPEQSEWLRQYIERDATRYKKKGEPRN